MNEEFKKTGLFEDLSKILDPHDSDYSDFERNEDGNLLSCCGDILDEDVMIYKTCKEHN